MSSQSGLGVEMDRERFDALTKLFVASASRRGALAGLLGAALAGPQGSATANTKRRKGKTKRRKKSGAVAAQAVDCLSLGHGANVSGCSYAGEDHSGEDLSSSTMVGTIFSNGTLAGADLSSSALRNARFNGAAMCKADLRSSNVRGATFAGADLTLANFKSAGGCGAATFTAGTTFCRTTMCDGRVRNDDCPGGPPAGYCCTNAECPTGQACQGGACCTTDPVAAIEAAAPGATVRICAGTYTVSPAPLIIKRNMTVVGAGAEATILDAQQENVAVWARPIETPANQTIELRDLTITGGKGNAISGGGGILNQAELTLIGVTVRNNEAAGNTPVGGGIANRKVLTLIKSTVRQNKAFLNGGGIFNGTGNTLTLGNGARIEGNTADGSGGGVFNAGTMTMQDGSRITTNNQTPNFGGGIYNFSAGSLTLQSGSRVETNTAAQGGGIFNDGLATLDPGAIVTGNTPDNCEPTIGTCS